VPIRSSSENPASSSNLGRGQRALAIDHTPALHAFFDRFNAAQTFRDEGDRFRRGDFAPHVRSPQVNLDRRPRLA
jgi:hypothetical protein